MLTLEAILYVLPLASSHHLKTILNLKMDDYSWLWTARSSYKMEKAQGWMLKEITWYEEKMVGWRFLMSKVGITTFVKVWSNFVFPNSLFIWLWRYFPSYFGPVKILKKFTTEPMIPLCFWKPEKGHLGWSVTIINWYIVNCDSIF